MSKYHPPTDPKGVAKYTTKASGLNFALFPTTANFSGQELESMFTEHSCKQGISADQVLGFGELVT